MFLDSDDYLPTTAVDDLMSVAVAENADIVEGNYKNFFPDGTITDGSKIHHATGKIKKPLEELHVCAATGQLARKPHHRIPLFVEAVPDKATYVYLHNYCV